MLTTAEKTRESSLAPPLTELVTRVEALLKTKRVSTSTTKDGCSGCSHVKGEGVIPSTEVNRAVGKRSTKHHAVTASTAINTAVATVLENNNKSDPASPFTRALLFTPAAKFKVSCRYRQESSCRQVPLQSSPNHYQHHHQCWLQSASRLLHHKGVITAPP